MTGNTDAVLTGPRDARSRPLSGGARPLRAALPLAAVAAAFTLAQLLLVRPGMGLGWDEAVYVSQVGVRAPAAYFSAPRARGISLLVAPVAAWSSSTVLLRCYLAVLSGLALYVASRAWRGLFPPRVIVLGAALFASLWVTLFYGLQAMPNYWVAVGASVTVGSYLRAGAPRSGRAAFGGLAAGAVLMGWTRPMDAVWVVLPLLATGLRHRHWHRLSVLLAGLAAGVAEWVVEAYVRYGGLLHRLSEGSAIQGGLGWHLAVVDQLRSLGGRTLCRPCAGALPGPLVTFWWCALPLLAALALLFAVRAGRTAVTALPLACAASAAFPYLFLIGYAAPRFLLPAYALLAFPVAAALLRLASAPPPRRRPVARGALLLVAAVHLGVQLTVLVRTTDVATAGHRSWSRTAATLHRLGVRAPCLVTGEDALPVAFYAGCSSAATSGPNADTTADAIARTARRVPTATLVPAGADPPGYARGWPWVAAGTGRLYYTPGRGEGFPVRPRQVGDG
ncbi:hypothetical protein [Streptomyces malaysiense]|uniref:Glycosyltransferase RgtA/B/C/D-like domain-containing protein n=1 Tax=Streptomyces malaysiense TaxID=1428626 RepID=A0A1J4Q990_9ACTN|nr:hypothetical protein [Streptomyces malaysiense]OIK29602.1 hypothetical protein VT52_000640 [Streptomyces malaysiense]